MEDIAYEKGDRSRYLAICLGLHLVLPIRIFDMVGRRYGDTQ